MKLKIALAVLSVFSILLFLDLYVRAQRCHDTLLGARRTWVEPTRLTCPRDDQTAEPYSIDDRDLVVVCVCPDRM